MPPQAPPRLSAARARFLISALLVICLTSTLAAMSSMAAPPTNSTTAPVFVEPQQSAAGPTPRYQTYSPPAGAGFGTDAGEPTLGVNFATGKVVFQSRLDTLRATFDDCTSPAQVTWESTRAPNAATSLDPILHTNPTVFKDANGKEFCRTFVSQLAGKASLSAYTDDDGATYTVSQGNFPVLAGVDHQTYGSGPYRPGANLNNPLQPFKHAVYYCSQDAVAANCSRSDDGGLTFGPPTTMYTLAQCAGIHGHVQVAPNGTVYVPNKACGSEQGVAVSEDNGLTWAVRTIPGSYDSVGVIDPAVGIGPNNTVYFGYQSGLGEGITSNVPKVAVSRDGGRTWTDDQIIGQELGIKNIVFPTVTVGDDDRAAVAFLGTSFPGNYRIAAEAKDAVWYLYIATTFDGGKTWTTVNATPNDPVQRGSICTSGTTCTNVPDDRNLLDFMDIVVDKEGRALAGFADGCVGSCVAGGANSYTAFATIARQSGGKRLFAQFDPATAQVPSVPQVTAAKESLGVRLAWPEPDNGSSPITGYNVYRGTEQGGAKTLLATVTETSFDDLTADPNTTYYYQVTAVNAAGESARCQEVSPAVIVLPDPCNVPGVLSSVDGEDSGQNTPPDARVDIKSVSVAEPFFADGGQKLVFTLKLAPSTEASAPPSSQWYIIWNRSDTTEEPEFDRNYVAMKSDLAGAVSYEYGRVAPTTNLPTSKGAADSGTYDPQNGTITITIANSKLDNVGAGGALAGLNVRTFFARVDGTPVTQLQTSDFSAEGSYDLRGNSFCKPSLAPTAALLASPQTGVAPLTVSFDASGSAAADSADNIVTYIFDFGDPSVPTEQQVVTQTSPMATFTYTKPGFYPVKLRVRDSRGKVSENVAERLIQVAEEGQVEATPSATTAPTTGPTTATTSVATPVPTTVATSAPTTAATTNPNQLRQFLPFVRR